MTYPQWVRGYRKHAYYVDETTAVAGVGIAPDPRICPRPPSFKPYGWWLYEDGGFVASGKEGQENTLRKAKRQAEKAYRSQVKKHQK